MVKWHMDLEKYLHFCILSVSDFVDRQDSSLAFAAFGAANHHSFPLAVVQVSPEGLPLEFLLCFHGEIGRTIQLN